MELRMELRQHNMCVLVIYCIYNATFYVIVSVLLVIVLLVTVLLVTVLLVTVLLVTVLLHVYAHLVEYYRSIIGVL